MAPDGCPTAASRGDHETDIMDILFFFKTRTDFIRRFYEEASLVFTDRMSKIEDGKPPYADTDDLLDESAEPPYQAEWGHAKDSLEVLGLTCVSMLAASLHAYFLAWEAELGVKWEKEKREREKLFKQKGLAGYVNELERLLKLPCGNCPAKLELLEQVILARNAAQHPDKITDLIPEHRKSDLEKHPRPFFMTEGESTLLEGDLADVSFLVPRVRISQGQLRHVVDEAESLAIWLDTHLHSRWGR